FFDRTLGRVIDNGNHLLLSGNRSARAYLDAIGAADTLVGPPDASFPFLDLATGERWTVRPNRGPLPFWVLLPSRRVSGTRFRDYLATRRLWRAGERHTVADCLRTDDVLWRRFWSPLATAVLNTPPTLGSARLLRAALEESFARGAASCRPLIARTSLAASLIDPALTFLRRHGVEIGFGQRLRAIELDDRCARSLDFGQRQVDLGPGDAVILTVCAPDDLAEEPSEAIAARLWADTAAALALPRDPQPPGRIVKERRATFAQTPEQAAKRPPAATRWSNLFLAGDWTATG